MGTREHTLAELDVVSPNLHLAGRYFAPQITPSRAGYGFKIATETAGFVPSGRNP